MNYFGGDDLSELPSDPTLDETLPPPPRSEPRTRSVRRPAKGRQGTGPKPAPRTRRAPSRPPEMSPAEAIRGILQIPATGAVMVGSRVGSVPLVADGATVIVHGPMLASAIEDVARHDPRVMAILERLVSFGPYAALTSALVIMTAQFIRNHNEENAPILEGFGAVPPEKIIEAASLEIPVAVSSNGQRNESPPADTV